MQNYVEVPSSFTESENQGLKHKYRREGSGCNLTLAPRAPGQSALSARPQTRRVYGLSWGNDVTLLPWSVFYAYERLGARARVASPVKVLYDGFGGGDCGVCAIYEFAIMRSRGVGENGGRVVGGGVRAQIDRYKV